MEEEVVLRMRGELGPQVSMHECIHIHTHTHTCLTNHCNTGGVAPTCTYTACGVCRATNTSGGHNKWVGYT